MKTTDSRSEVLESLRDWLARVEILARGAERLRSEAVRALAAGRPWVARRHALMLLTQLPQSRLALGLWAEAASAMWLDHEAAEALGRLAPLVPFRADVWLRLGEAQTRLGLSPRDAYERAAAAGEPTTAADVARLRLAEVDLRASDPARAEQWLARLTLGTQYGAWAQELRVEAMLDQGQVARALQVAKDLPPPELLDTRGWVLRARMPDEGDPEGSQVAMRRALLLASEAESKALADGVSCLTAPGALQKVRALVTDLGWSERPEWRAAFASAEGRPGDALSALAQALRADPSTLLLQRYVRQAVQSQSADALLHAADLAAQRNVPLDRGVDALVRALRAESARNCLQALDGATGSASGWAQVMRLSVYRSWLPEQGPSHAGQLMAELAHLAREFGEAGWLRDLGAVCLDLGAPVPEALEPAAVTSRLADLSRPLRVIVVGEFNAGKSSFVNALLGEEVAPVGVVPTTATVNRLGWAPDRFARIERTSHCGESDRLVAHDALRSVLAELDPTSVAAVAIYAPIEALRRIELWDTPGFNAPQREHGDQAGQVMGDADAAIWLMDAAQPLKASELGELRRLQATKVPLVVMVNKVDRLLQGPGGVEAAARALDHVIAGLGRAKIHLECPPIVLSARLALLGQAGDEDAFLRSNWARARELVERVLVERAPTLREQGLRRRLAKMAGAAASVVRRREHERAAALGRSEQAQAMWKEAGRRLAENSDTLAERLRWVVDASRAEWERDVLPAAAAPGGRSASRFVRARTRVLLGRPLTDALVQWLGLGSEAVDARSTEAQLGRLLGPRIEAVSAALAQWLVPAVAGPDRPMANGSRPPERDAAWVTLVEAAIEELRDVLSQGLAREELDAICSAEQRALALAVALGVDLPSGDSGPE